MIMCANNKKVFKLHHLFTIFNTWFKPGENIVSHHSLGQQTSIFRKKKKKAAKVESRTPNSFLYNHIYKAKIKVENRSEVREKS